MESSTTTTTTTTTDSGESPTLSLLATATVAASSSPSSSSAATEAARENDTSQQSSDDEEEVVPEKQKTKKTGRGRCYALLIDRVLNLDAPRWVSYHKIVHALSAQDPSLPKQYRCYVRKSLAAGVAKRKWERSKNSYRVHVSAPTVPSVTPAPANAPSNSSAAPASTVGAATSTPAVSAPSDVSTKNRKSKKTNRTSPNVAPPESVTAASGSIIQPDDSQPGADKSDKGVWQYFDPDKGGWNDYDAAASSSVEKVYQDYLIHPGNFDVRSVFSGKFHYLVDFHNLKQTNIDHQNHTVRDIRRLEKQQQID